MISQLLADINNSGIGKTDITTFNKYFQTSVYDTDSNYPEDYF